MSEKGVLSKSIASNISEAIINKLGGTGYAPTEWSRNINLLGIHSTDIADALASITEDAPSADKGLLSLPIASDVGAMLNKKYNTSRGFKPCEVSSAVSALTPLPEKTASSAPICAFSDGANDVPLKSCEVALPASLDGYSSVDVVQSGKNLVDGTNFTSGLPSTSIGASIDTISASTRYAYFGTPIKGGNYTVSSVSNDADYYNAILIFGYSNGYLSVYTGGTVNGNKNIDLSTCDYIRVAIGTRNNTFIVPTDFTDYGTIQLEVGSTASNYEPFVAPTTHTVNLGRTIYGGSVDVVNGEGTDGYAKDSMTSAYLSGLPSSYIAYEASTNFFGGHPTIWIRNWHYQEAKERQTGGIGCICNKFPVSMNNTSIVATQYRIYFDVNGKNISSVSDFIAFVQNLEANNESLDIVYELNDTHMTDFTFEPVEINSKLGDNTMWSDSGDTEVTYRADLDLEE